MRLCHWLSHKLSWRTVVEFPPENTKTKKNQEKHFTNNLRYRFLNNCRTRRFSAVHLPLSTFCCHHTLQNVLRQRRIITEGLFYLPPSACCVVFFLKPPSGLELTIIKFQLGPLLCVSRFFSTLTTASFCGCFNPNATASVVSVGVDLRACVCSF